MAKNNLKLYISIKPMIMGGGSNTFAYNFYKYAKKSGIKIVSKIKDANCAIIIANRGSLEDIKEAKKKGCFIIHRVDEYFEKDETDYRKEKHELIKSLNKLSDITVFQSMFVKENAVLYLKPENYKVILNGSDPLKFKPADKPGSYIGHVTWGADRRKRLDLLYGFIGKHPDEKFLLIGNHKKSDFNFKKFKNVKTAGKVMRYFMPGYYRKMKCLYFPVEKDPCPNTVIESILSGVPVCFNSDGGTKELVKDCGLELDRFDELNSNLSHIREKCKNRTDLYFDNAAKEYLKLIPGYNNESD